MRLFFAYLISGLVHVGFLAGLSYCLTNDDALRLDLARGEAIVVVYSLPSSEAQPPPASQAEVSIEASSEVVPDTNYADHGAQPTEVTKQTTDMARVETRELIEPPPSSKLLANDNPPPSAKPAKEQSEPEKSTADHKPLPRPTKPVPNLAVESTVSMPFQMPVHVGADVDELPRNISTNRPPLYPADALTSGIQGRVMLRLFIAASGEVRSASIETSSGSPSLDSAALTAANSWKFHPARRKGRQVAHEVLYPVRFSIRG